MSQLQLRPNSLYVIARVLIAAFGVTDALTSDVPSHSNCRSVSTRYEPANPACVSPRRFELTVSSVYVYKKRVQDRLREEIVLLNNELD